jgi:hypothetical protein
MSNISIVNLSAYTSPVIQENKKEDFIEYGSDNNYFQYLIDRYLYSATNNAIITGVTNMIYGKGIDAIDANKKPNEYAQMRSIIKGDMLKKVALERKMLGMAAMQVVMEKGLVKKIDHFPMHTLRAEKCNDKGEIEAWYYYPDWTKKKPSEAPKRIPAFGFGNGNEVEIYVIKPYVSGFHYYTPIDYSGALPYSVLEEEIGDYLINDVQNGFSGTKVINFNNGIPSEEMRDQIKRDVLGKLTGSRGQKVVVAFNDNAESKTTVDDIPLNDAPAHYDYLSKECFEKLIVGHRVTAPMLLGIRENGGGFSNNADEIETSTLIFLNLVIKPYQEEILDALDRILAINDISLDLKFIRIQPLNNEQVIVSENPIIEAVNSLSPLVANKVLESMTANEIRSLVGLAAEAGGSNLNPSVSSKLSSAEKICCSSDKDFTDEEGNRMLDYLEGESVDEEWELVDKRQYSDSNESIEDWANSKINQKENLFQKLAGVIKSNSSSKSYLDKDTYKVRYEYSEISGTDREKSRDFCRQMMSRTERGVVYRKEDIDQASFAGVNNEFGHNRQNYSLWLYAGGIYCHHFWNENLYRLKTKTDGTPYVDKSLASSEEVSSISGYNPNPVGSSIAKIAPINRAGRGEYPS